MTNKKIRLKGQYSNIYPPCLGALCKRCKAQCQGEGLDWRSGGKECFQNCKATDGETAEQYKEAQTALLAGLAIKGAKSSTGLYIGLFVGFIMLTSFAVFIIKKSRKK